MGNVASELQHIGNQLEGSGADERAFLAAVFENKPDEASRLLREKPMVIWAYTKDNLNAWHIAAQAGNVEMLEVLHKHGQGWTKLRKPLPGQPAPVNYTSRTGQTPLMLACEGGHSNAMQFMLVAGANLLDADKYGNTALHWAAYRGQAKVLEILLAKSEAEGAHDGKSRFVNLRNEAGLAPLHFAAYSGALAAARVLVQYKSKLLSQTEADSMNLVTCSSGSTPLHLAAMKGDIAMATFLLEEFVKQSSDPARRTLPDPRTLRDGYNLTPLQVAANLQRASIMPLLDPTRTRLESFKAHEGSGKGAPPTALFRSGSDKQGQVVVQKQHSARSSTTGAHTLPSSLASPCSSTGGTAPHSPPPAASGRISCPAGGRNTSAGGGFPGACGGNDDGDADLSGGRGSGTPGAANGGAVAGASYMEDALAPPEFICPITSNVMEDPVVAGDGRTYERSAIEMWLELGSAEFPGGGETRVVTRAVTPNTELGERIIAWRAGTARAGLST